MMKNKITKNKFYMSEKGYSIIELLTVIGILVIITSLITAILYSTLRGSGKTKITTAVAQNGNYALSVISNAIISSDAVTSIGANPINDCTASPSGQMIGLKYPDGSTVSISCSGNTISSNSASLIDTTQVQIDTSNPANCYFYCSQNSTDPYAVPVVGFGFTITEKTGSSFFENKSSAVFNTSVSLRNFSP